MWNNQLKTLVKQIIQQASELKEKHAPQFSGHVSYCAVFCQSDAEFTKFHKQALKIGKIADETKTGPVFAISPINTASGPLRIVKIRRPDLTRTERGDADFGLDDYDAFKDFALARNGFSLIERDAFEMIELVDPAFDVRAYFSNPPVEEHAGIKGALSDS